MRVFPRSQESPASAISAKSAQRINYNEIISYKSETVKSSKVKDLWINLLFCAKSYFSVLGIETIQKALREITFHRGSFCLYQTVWRISNYSFKKRQTLRAIIPRPTTIAETKYDAVSCGHSAAGSIIGNKIVYRSKKDRQSIICQNIWLLEMADGRFLNDIQNYIDELLPVIFMER